MKILISGASRGIGYETALRLSVKHQATVIALSRNASALHELSLKANKQGGTIIPFAADLLTLSDKDIMNFFNQHSISRLDALVNNAGLLINKPFEKLSISDWKKIYDVNVFGCVQLLQSVLPYMGIESRAHIINIGSFGGFQGTSKFSGLAAYSSSKAALANLTECLAEEFKGKNISVNCLALGAIETEMFREAFPGNSAPVNAANMAEFIAWFVVNGSEFFNGKILPVTLGQV